MLHLNVQYPTAYLVVVSTTHDNQGDSPSQFQNVNVLRGEVGPKEQ